MSLVCTSPVTPAVPVILSGLHLPWPSNWPIFFGRTASLLLEIGFGGGHFLVDLARRHPDANVLGVERSHYSLIETEARIAKARLSNVRLIHADALPALAYLCAPDTLDGLYINFPDPFPKKSHAKRRWLTPESMALIASRLKVGARVTIATDVRAYAEQIAEALARTPALHSLHLTPWVHALPDRSPTRYERKARDQGTACYYFEWTRHVQTSTEIQLLPIFVQLPMEEIMPNAVLHSPLSLEEIIARFTPVQDTYGAFHIHRLTLYREYTGRGLLIDTFIDEPLVEQRLAVLIDVSGNDAPGRCVVRLDALGYPRATPGAHLAVHVVVEWLRSLHPDVTLIHRAIQLPDGVTAAASSSPSASAATQVVD